MGLRKVWERGTDHCPPPREELSLIHIWVLFEGDYATLVRANLNSRYSERILILLKSFRATTFEQLFEGVKSIPWENFLHQEDEFPVSGSSLSSKLYSVPDCQAIIKKAVVERLKTKYHVSWFQETGPLHRIRFRLLKDEASVMPVSYTHLDVYKRQG